MNVIDVNELKYATEYLKSAANREQDMRLKIVLVDVVRVLEQAIEEHKEDKQLHNFYLSVVKAPSLLDQAIDVCCTTDCSHVINSIKSIKLYSNSLISYTFR
jgi:hypothetical protein